MPMDVHSGLSHFRWWAGRTPGGSDIYPTTRVHLLDSVSVQLSSQLPIGQTIYVTVEAVDLAGECSQSMSKIMNRL